MKKQVIYVHGGDSFAKHEDFLTYLRNTPLRDPLGTRPSMWPDTLRAELGLDYEVFMPTMPNKFNARYEEWVIWFERYLELVNNGVILVGWSLGGMFLAKYLSENKPPKDARAVFLLAAPGGDFVDGGGSGGDCISFRPQAELVSKLTEAAPHLEIWHSEDDFVVPFSELEWYKNHLSGAIYRTFIDKNHFLLPELPELVQKIKEI